LGELQASYALTDGLEAMDLFPEIFPLTLLVSLFLLVFEQGFEGIDGAAAGQKARLVIGIAEETEGVGGFPFHIQAFEQFCQRQKFRL